MTGFCVAGLMAFWIGAGGAVAGDSGWRLGDTMTLDDLKRGEELYRIGQCAKCHQDDARGGGRGPNLRDEVWDHCDGSVDGIRGVLERGVSREELKDKSRRFGMNPATNAIPEPADIAILAAYIKSLSDVGKSDEKPKSSDEESASEGGDSELGEAVADDEFKFKIRPPQGWREAPVESVTVPGKARKVWSPDGVSSIVVFIQTPESALTPRMLLDLSVAGLKKAGFEIQKERIGKLGEMKAMNVVVAGKGTGGALTGTGEVQTVQHWVAVPRSTDVLVVLLTCPESEFKERSKTLQRVVKSMEIGGEQTKEQRESK